MHERDEGRRGRGEAVDIETPIPTLLSVSVEQAPRYIDGLPCDDLVDYAARATQPTRFRIQLWPLCVWVRSCHTIPT